MPADKRTLFSIVYSTLFLLIPVLTLSAQNDSGIATTIDQNNRVDAILNQMQQEMPIMSTGSPVFRHPVL